jgi:hypothetical protein
MAAIPGAGAEPSTTLPIAEHGPLSDELLRSIEGAALRPGAAACG